MTATIAETLPDHVRGRAYGATESMYAFAGAVGSVGFAWLGDAGRVGPARAMALSGAIGCLLALAVLAVGGIGAIRRSEGKRLAAGARSQDPPLAPDPADWLEGTTD